MNDDERKIDYEKSANDYKRWLYVAEDLCLAANYLEKVHEEGIQELNKLNNGSDIEVLEKISKISAGSSIFAPMQYVRAKSLEVYFKALHLKRGNKITDGKGSLLNIYKQHGLYRLCCEYVVVSKDEKVLLDKFTEAMIFWGTYPVPTNYSKWRRDVDGVTGLQPIYTWHIQDDIIYKGLIDKIKIILDK